MIEGFEYITADLTDSELKLVAKFVKGFQDKIGVFKAVKSQKIISGFKKEYNIDLSGARVRKIINYIRINGLVPNLVATSKGYYIEPSPTKRKAYVNSLHQRAHAILAVAKSFEV